MISRLKDELASKAHPKYRDALGRMAHITAYSEHVNTALIKITEDRDRITLVTVDPPARNFEGPTYTTLRVFAGNDVECADGHITHNTLYIHRVQRPQVRQDPRALGYLVLLFERFNNEDIGAVYRFWGRNRESREMTGAVCLATSPPQVRILNEEVLG